MKQIDICALGEILIDFTMIGVSENGQQLFEANPGGAPANTVAAAARLGARTAFIGKTGIDAFGALLENTLRVNGVNVSGLAKSKEHTTLAFVTLTESGERSFSFCRNPGADTQIEKNELDRDLLRSTRFLHIGSLSLTHEPSRSATFEAIKIVQEAGGYISYDPNWREPLWTNSSEGISAMKSILPYADIVKISDSELVLLVSELNGEDCQKEESLYYGAEKIASYGPSLVVITLGSRGLFYYRKSDSQEPDYGLLSVPEVCVVDTTGAGDSFNGGLLYRFTIDAQENPFTKDVGSLIKDLEYAQAVASLCVTKRGAIPALPRAEEVRNFVEKMHAGL